MFVLDYMTSKSVTVGDRIITTSFFSCFSVLSPCWSGVQNTDYFVLDRQRYHHSHHITISRWCQVREVWGIPECCLLPKGVRQGRFILHPSGSLSFSSLFLTSVGLLRIRGSMMNGEGGSDGSYEQYRWVTETSSPSMHVCFRLTLIYRCVPVRWQNGGWTRMLLVDAATISSSDKAGPTPIGWVPKWVSWDVLRRWGKKEDGWGDDTNPVVRKGTLLLLLLFSFSFFVSFRMFWGEVGKVGGEGRIMGFLSTATKQWIRG